MNKLIEESKPFLTDNTGKIKRIFNSLGITINKAYIKPTSPATVNKKLRQYIQISLPGINLDLV